MTICSYWPVLLQSPSKAYDIAMARWALALAVGVVAPSIAFWNRDFASAVLPSRSSCVPPRISGDPPRPPCAARAAVAAMKQKSVRGTPMRAIIRYCYGLGALEAERPTAETQRSQRKRREDKSD